MTDKKKKIISEKLIVSELGYLKIPQGIKDIHGTPTKYPNPDAYEYEDEQKLILVYEWDKKEIKRLQGKKGDD